MTKSLQELLDSCGSEPIHIPGAIQPFGALLAADATGRLIHCSANVAEMAGLEPAAILGRAVGEALPAALARLFDAAAEPRDGNTRLATAILQGRNYDAFVHRRAGNVLVELEPAGADPATEAETLGRALRAALPAMDTSTTLLELCQQSCIAIQELAGLDGVMAYRFHPDGHGEVIAEVKRPGCPLYLGLHYPASDIPPQARAVFLENWVRMIPDRDYVPVPLLAAPGTTEPLDLGRSLLRSVSPVHIEYLRNMGVRASLTLSLVRGGKLWGLLAGHHYREPRHVPFAARSACEIVARIASAQLGPRGEQEIASARNRARRIRDALARGGDDATAASAQVPAVAGANGAAMRGPDGAWMTFGATPAPAQIEELVAWLATKGADADLFHTRSLAAAWPPAVQFAPTACGLLALRIPKGEDDFLLWFKPEAIETVSWAGDPHKVVSATGDGQSLHPRSSFDAWKETVRLTSAPWQAWQIEEAQELRRVLVELDLQRQFRRAVEARTEAERAREQMEMLMAVVSHDLRNPLHSLLLNVAVLRASLRAEPAAAKVENVITGMQRSLQGMSTLITDLLSVAKLEAGVDSLELKDVPAAELADDILQMLQPIAAEQQVTLEFGQEDDLQVTCDRDRILQVLANLVGNAVKFTPPEGRVRLRAFQDGSEVCFAVEDTGPGIAREDLPHVFDRFYQARQARRLGTGLGLSIARSIVEAHQGRIWVDSVVGKGSTFTFALPRRAPRAVGQAAGHAAQ